MAQDSVVKDQLTEAMIRAGAELTRKLDELGWPVLASLWLYLSDGNHWKLILASPRVASDGPKRSYEIIQAALIAIPAAEGTIALSDIGVIDPNNPLIVLLRGAVSTGPTVGRSEEHTSELQSPCNLVCRLLLEKKKKIQSTPDTTLYQKMSTQM